jgi:predicted DNA-binding transcriptional regulator AlpA
MDAETLSVAKAMLKDPTISVAAVAKRLGVARATLYNHIPEARLKSVEGAL